MLAIERLEKIKAILQTEKNVKISQLSERLNVSEMTIHRDLKPLIDDNYVIKTFGGVSLVTSTPINDTINEQCIYCHRPIHGKMAYKLILANQQTEFACCAHCGLLRQIQLGDEVVQAISYDFLRQTTISVPRAFFVMDTSLDLGCCQPQVLCFEWKEHADKFIQGFGGNVYTFNSVLTTLQEKMSGNDHSCHT